MIDITMPRLSESMNEGKLLRWSVAEGQTVVLGTPLAEIEADKANMEIEAPQNGVLKKLIVSPGETVSVGTVLATMDEVADGSLFAHEASDILANQATVEDVATRQSPLESRIEKAKPSKGLP